MLGETAMTADASLGATGTAGESAVLARNWWAFALRGAVAILFGIVAIASPGAVMVSLAMLFAAYLIVDGAFGIVSAVRAAQAHERWGWLIAEAVLNIAMGVLVFAFPTGAVIAFVLVTALWALLTGGAMLVAAFKVHPEYGRWWLTLGGVVSLGWGVLLLVSPLLGAVVLTWWLGGYAIAFGVILLIFAFQLKGRAAT